MSAQDETRLRGDGSQDDGGQSPASDSGLASDDAAVGGQSPGVVGEGSQGDGGQSPASDRVLASAGGAGGGQSPGDLRQRLADAEASRDEYLGDLQRVAADFDNYRKRVLRDSETLARRATAGLVERLLPVLDDLERALDAAEHHDEAKVVEGVRLTRATLWNLLAQEGVSEIEADGAPFDPHVHEALLTQPAEDVEPGAIVQVLQKGYRHGDAVVRPVRVIVAE
ncbi:MAG: nucleotide exchange factor GrpE [Gaiella sp.]